MTAQCREVLPIHPLSEEAMTDNLLRTISDNLAICLRTGNKCENLLLTVEQLQRVHDLLTGAELKKLYEQVDELRVQAKGDVYNPPHSAYSRVLGLINTMLAGREDVVPVSVEGDEDALKNLLEASKVYFQRRLEMDRANASNSGGAAFPGGRDRFMMNLAAAEEYLLGCQQRAEITLRAKLKSGCTMAKCTTPELCNTLGRCDAAALRVAQPDAQPTHHYTAAEIDERLATAGSHPGSDARDLQMLRQVCRTLAEKELLITSAAATLHSMYEVGVDGSEPWWGEDFLVSLRQFREAGYCPYPSAEATSHDPS